MSRLEELVDDLPYSIRYEGGVRRIIYEARLTKVHHEAMTKMYQNERKKYQKASYENRQYREELNGLIERLKELQQAGISTNTNSIIHDIEKTLEELE